jgi:hypothetical protein
MNRKRWYVVGMAPSFSAWDYSVTILAEFSPPWMSVFFEKFPGNFKS